MKTQDRHFLVVRGEAIFVFNRLKIGNIPGWQVWQWLSRSARASLLGNYAGTFWRSNIKITDRTGEVIEK